MQNGLELKGKRALIGGASQGIGLACAQKLAEKGASVVLVARDGAALASAAATILLSDGAECDTLSADYDRPDELRAAVSAYVAAKPCTILINNTGGPPGGPIIDALAEEFLLAFNRHLVCNQILAQTLLPEMRAKKYGRIINVVSTSVRQPLKGLGVSNTIRAAVAGWAKTWANETAALGVTVNNVLPGATRTRRLEEIIRVKAEKTARTIAEIEREMLAEIPAGRFGAAEEIAALVAFLASPAAAYVTGQSIAADGGRISAI